jgi:hypothetical protein
VGHGVIHPVAVLLFFSAAGEHDCIAVGKCPAEVVYASADAQRLPHSRPATFRPAPSSRWGFGFTSLIYTRGDGCTGLGVVVSGFVDLTKSLAPG